MMSTSSRLPYLAAAAVSGLLFGAGLYISQMVDPLKVLRFLDFTAIPTGGWDPSLAFVIVRCDRRDVCSPSASGGRRTLRLFDSAVPRARVTRRSTRRW